MSLCGDPTPDGHTTADAVLYTLRTAVGAVSCEPCICDVNASGSITASDALGVLRAAVGLWISLDCPACS